MNCRQKLSNQNRISCLNWIEKHQRLTAFAIASVLFLLLHFVKKVTDFPWDSGEYWELSELDLLLDFPKNIRGYFYPALLAPARFISDAMPAWGFLPYRVISSLAYAYVLTGVLPTFYMSIFGGKVGFLRRLIAPVFVTLLFPGVIVYSLSDLPALAIMLGAIVSTTKSADPRVTPSRRNLLLFLGGLLAYGAYNTRTIYIFSMFLTFVAVPVVVYRNYPTRLKALAAVLFFVGMSAASVPQIAINLKTHGITSPGVITTPSANRSLFANQLLWGITLQRYETSIDAKSPGPGVFFMDKAGERLFIANNIGGTAFNVPDYLMLMLKNPLEFVGIFGRHIVNGLDLRDGEVYTKRLSGEKTILAVFNFLVVFLGLAIMVAIATPQRISGRQIFVKMFWFLLMMLPVLAIVPGAIETRFFLPLHLVIYCAIAFNGDFRMMLCLKRNHWILIALAFGISALLFFSVSTTTMTNVQYVFSDLYRGLW